MDGNQKKRKLPLIIMLSTIVVLCGIFAGLCLSGVMPVPTKYGWVSFETAMKIQNATRVSDEETLRELLLMDGEMDILVQEDLYIQDTFTVKGTKTLYGNATIQADIAGLFEQRSIFSVSKGAHLTMQGLVLDGRGMADGIEVRQNGTLTYLSGRIQYVRYGITAHGTVTVEDFEVEHIATAGIYASFKSEIYVKGGTICNSYANLLNVETGGYMEVYEGVLVTDSIGVGVVNSGTLRLYGGEISHTGGHGIENKGDLLTEYRGEKADGYIYIHNTTRRAINVNTSDDTVIKDLYAREIGSNAIYVTDKVTQGDITLENCIFDHCGLTDGNTFSFYSNVTVKDVEVLNAVKGGLYVRDGGKVTAENVTVKNCARVAIEVLGELKADNVTVDGCGTNGLAVGFTASAAEALEEINSYAEITNMTMSNVAGNNIVIRKGASATVANSTLNKCNRTGVYVTEGGSLVLDSTKVLGVKDDILNVIDMEPNTTVTMKGDSLITGATDRRAVKVQANATFNMEGGTICDVNASVSGPAVGLVAAGATFNMSGGTICNNTTAESSGAVYVEKGATFNMTGGTISGNTAKKSGGAAQIRGEMYMSGGIIENNEAGTNGGGLNAGANAADDVYGKIVITGGIIRNNHSNANGGGASVSGGTSVLMTGGTISGNTALGIGSGIYTNGDVTLGKDVYIKDNAIELNEADVVVKIQGSGLTNHSESDPLYIIPDYELAQQGVVVVCESANAAKALAASVKSGSEAYSFYASSNNIVSSVLLADMDMTGADKVYASNFKQLKEAVETTTDKRYVVITADIPMESVITVPQGTTVCIKDDGSVRKLTRTASLESNFFRTYYGTGLYLTGTAYGNLILDGTANNGNANEPILRVRGTTEIRNVVFQDNYTKGDGAFIRHHFGFLYVYDSSFTGGKAESAAGAVKIVAGSAYFENVSFDGNTSTKSGGAIKVEDLADAKVELVDCHFTGNTAGTLGGAINAAGGSLTATDCSFSGNTAKDGKAGAISATDCVATVTGGSFVGNRSAEEAGALYVNKTKLTLSGTDFISNTSDRGGALYIGGSGEDDGNEIMTCRFLSNSAIGIPEDKDDASGKGGAIFNSTKTTRITDCTFGAEGYGNTANSNGGALYVASGAVVSLVGTDARATFAHNNTMSDGGAICVGSGTLNVSGYTFDHNSADNAGAIQFNNSKIAGNIDSCTFVSNRATSAHGGAVKVNVTSDNGSKVVISNSVFGGSGTGNTAKKNGGAIWLAEKATTDIVNSQFVGNSVLEDSTDADINRGGAIFSDGATLTIVDTKFDANASVMRGAAVYSGNNGTLVLKGTGDNAVFVNNTSNKGGAAIGAGSGTISVSGYQFVTNSSQNDGGAVWIDVNVVMQIKASSFVGNATNGTGSGDDHNRGGAIFNNGGVLTVVDTKFDGNTAVKNGGAIFTGKDGTLSLVGNGDNAVLNANTTEADGGAICVGSGTLNINGYTITGNKGNYGGAIRLNNGTGIVVDIQNVVFDNNRADNGQGGALYNNSKDAETVIRIINSEIKNSYSKASGGAIYSLNGNLLFKNSTFSDNQGSVGGVLNLAGGSLTADSCIFENNTARSTGSEGGGAIIMSGGSTLDLKGNGSFKNNTSGYRAGAIHINASAGAVEITGYTFEGNEAAAQNGGAIYSAAASGLTVRNTNFISNVSMTSGGAIYVAENSSLTAIDSNFVSNTGTSNGGAIYSYMGTLDLNGCKFTSNTTTGNGGAMDLEETKATVTKCDFVSNTAAKYGGAVDVYGSDVTFTQCSFVSNESTGSFGGAVMARKKSSATSILTMNDCMLTNNTSKSQGGAVRIVENTTAAITGGSFTGNKCTDNIGGAISIGGSGSLCVDAVTFKGNTATNGSDISLEIASTVKNCTFETVGTIYFKNDTVKNGSTISDNVYLDAE